LRVDKKNNFTHNRKTTALFKILIKIKKTLKKDLAHFFTGRLTVKISKHRFLPFCSVFFFSFIIILFTKLYSEVHYMYVTILIYIRVRKE